MPDRRLCADILVETCGFGLCAMLLVVVQATCCGADNENAVVVDPAIVRRSPGVETVADVLLPGALTARPVLDGRLDDLCWQQAAFRSFPGPNGDADSRTEFAVAADPWGIYVAFRCHQEDVSALRADCEHHDGLFEWFRKDDWVELLVDPGDTGHDYYWLLVNPAGMKTDLCCLADPDRSWNGAWQAATGREEQAWTVEAFIPRAVFNRSQAGPRWGINLARLHVSTSQEDEHGNSISKRTVWRGAHRRPSTWTKLVVGDVPDKRFAYAVAPVILEADGTDGSARVSTTVRNLTGRDVALRCVFELARPARARGLVPHGWGPGEQLRPAPVSLPAGESRQVIAQTTQGDADEVVIAQALLYDSAGNLVFCSPDRGVRLRQAIDGPGPELSLYTGEPVARVRFELLEFGPDKSLKLLLRRGDIEVACRDLPATEARIETSLDLERTPVGRYRLVAELTEQSTGRLIARRGHDLVKADPAPAGEVKIDRWRRVVLVDAEPLAIVGNSPLVTHGVEYARGMMRQMSANGFNTMHLWGGFLRRNEAGEILPELDLQKITACFDGAADAGLKVIVSLGPLVQNNPKSPFRKLVLADAEHLGLITELVRHLRTRTELLAYEIADEPEFFVAPEWLERVYREIKRLDPYHLVTINNCRGARSALTYGHASDMLGGDYYPVGKWPPGTVGPLADELVHFAGHKPVKMWVQGYKVFNPRAPTPDELRMMTYSMLARGASALFYFIGRPEPALWDAQGQCAREVRRLTDAVAADHRERLVVEPAGSGVYASFRSAPAGWWIVAVNEGRDAVEVTVELPSGVSQGGAEVLFESRRVPVDGGRIADSFAPFQRHVYHAVTPRGGE